ncbi:MAG TPA: T9SS type A sorting domain-containing protein, partial [Rhodothermales bacterium]|nr:T9SS type A sorting domain-containing protein [Rhodothermales bacterium]
GSMWHSVGGGVDGFPRAIAVFNGDVYVGGSSIQIGGTKMPVVRWDGQTWAPIGTGLQGTEPAIYAFAVDESGLYAGGRFLSQNDQRIQNVARWNGEFWSAVGSGLVHRDGYGGVYALVWEDGRLYAGGLFDESAGAPMKNIASWDGLAWADIGGGVGRQVHDLAIDEGQIYVAGDFQFVGANSSDHDGAVRADFVARWNGFAWKSLDSGLNAFANAIDVWNGRLYVGGRFTTAGDTPSYYFAQWNPETGTSAEKGIMVPSAAKLEGNYPNPFGGSTTIRYRVHHPTHVRLTVYDVLGRELKMLVDSPRGAGVHEASLDAELLPGGTYLYRLQAGGSSATGTMLLVR